MQLANSSTRGTGTVRIGCNTASPIDVFTDAVELIHHFIVVWSVECSPAVGTWPSSPTVIAN